MLARNRAREALAREIANSRDYACDVTDEAQLEATIAAIRRDLGDPRVLVHNAGERSELSWKSSRRH
jgi:NAD(P)-dependent dehydrogenase (short-subunit alcohol dehydrogenase family)